MGIRESKQRDAGPSVEVKGFRNPVAGWRGSEIQWLGPRDLGIALSGSGALRFLDIQNPVAKLGDPGLEAWGSRICQWI